MAPHRVLVTGMSGLIGTALRRHLEARYALRALNRRPVAGVVCYQADLADLTAIQPAFDGVDVVVHLAAQTGNPPFEEVLRTNVVGTHNVFEAARRAGVNRLVYASSGATVSACERDEPYRALVEGRYADVKDGWTMLTHAMAVRPAGLYGASKVWGEALARHYADAHGLSAICLRIGRVHAEDRPLSVRDFSVWCSQRDIVRMIELAVAAPDSVRFDVFYVTSNNRWSYRDLAHARDVLGFEPRDTAEDYR
ncbi:MAG: NAD-dependent epimerase/dehydratase family protein [Candidatus Rokubacteria bacterium]|nr:NAD-dependent epimerase/dehydratase family protein [Candidatus Rokubacteria bacterium]